MRQTSTACGITLALLALLLGAQDAGAQESPPPSAAEEEDPYAAAYAAAAALVQQGDWSAAAEKYREAASLRPTSAVFFNLAQAERNLGQLAAARAHFAEARRRAESEGAADVVSLAEAALEETARRVPKVTLRIAPRAKGVRVSVDGKAVSDFRGPLELDPGTHRITVTAQGEPPFIREIDVAEGARRDLVVTFGSPPAKPARTEAAPERDVGGGAPAGAVVLAGVSAAAFIGAVVFHVRRNAKLEDAATGCVRAGNKWSCPASVENDAEHTAARDAASSAETVRNVAIGVGAAALVGAGVWWALSGPAEQPATAVAVSPLPGGGAARLRLAF